MELDALDAAILRALLADARMSLRAVARAVGSTPTTVGERLRRLEAAGVVMGSSLRVAPRFLPGRSRLIRGRIRTELRAGILEAAGTLPGVAEAAVTRGGRLIVFAVVRDLADEERLVAALRDAGATDLAVESIERAQGPSAVHLFAHDVALVEVCAQCGRETLDVIESRVDGRRVPFCCTSCRSLFLERHARLKSRA